MKNKKLIYLLVPLVIAIWGIIFYRIYTQMHKSNDRAGTIINLPKTNTSPLVPDTVKLLLNYRDPFQAYSFSRKYSTRTSVSNTIQQSKSESKPKSEFIWPDIRFSGLIINSKTKTKTGIIIYNNKSFLVSEGDKIENYRISKLYADSVQVQFNKMKKTFKR